MTKVDSIIEFSQKMGFVTIQDVALMFGIPDTQAVKKLHLALKLEPHPWLHPEASL